MSATKKLTDAVIGKMTVNRLRDTEITGFVAVRRQTGVFMYLEYRSPTTGGNRKYPIGKVANIGVSKARSIAKQVCGQIAQGVDPLEAKHVRRQEQDRATRETLQSFMETDYCHVATEKAIKANVLSIKKHFPGLLNKRLSQITAWELEAWKKSYKGKPSGGNRILASLSSVLTKAVQAGLLARSPMSDVKKMKVDKSEAVKALNQEQVGALLAALNTARHDYLKPIITLALHTGLRRGELFNLRVSDIDLKNRILTVQGSGSKTGQSRRVPLNTKAFSVLVEWMNKTAPTDHIFINPRTRKPFKQINKEWDCLRTSAGLPSARFHDLRHTFGTMLARENTDLVTIKKLMGHGNLATTGIYLHTDQATMKRAVAALL